MFKKKNKDDSGKDALKGGSKPIPGGNPASPAAEAPAAAPPFDPLASVPPGTTDGVASGQVPQVQQGQQNVLDQSLSANSLPPQMTGRPGSTLKSSFSNIPAAGSEEEKAAQGQIKDRSKTSIVFDVILPVVMAVVCCGGFAMTVKQAKDKTDVYGLTAEQKDLEIKDKTIAAETVIAEINKLEPLTLLSHGEPAQAVAAAKALAAKKPNDVRSLMAAGMVLVEAGNKAEREIGINYSTNAYEQAKYSRYIRLLYARQLALLHRDEEAIAVYEKIIQLFPSNWSIPRKELANLYMKTNSADKAVEELQTLIKVDDSDPGARRELGLALAQAGHQQEGFEEFQKGFTREQDVLGYPYAVKSLVEAHGGLVDSALRDTLKRYAKNPDDVKTILTLARLYIAKNKIKEARDMMQKALKLRETDPEVHEVMAEVMVRQNQSQSGYDEFRAAASSNHLK
jgi:tetratricopeptide (TPR) repeat protein